MLVALPRKMLDDMSPPTLIAEDANDDFAKLRTIFTMISNFRIFVTTRTLQSYYLSQCKKKTTLKETLTLLGDIINFSYLWFLSIS